MTSDKACNLADDLFKLIPKDCLYKMAKQAQEQNMVDITALEREYDPDILCKSIVYNAILNTLWTEVDD